MRDQQPSGWQLHRGAQPGGHFEQLKELTFCSASAADFLQPTDEVIGVSSYGLSKAYPRRVVALHHIVQDELGGLPIIATWCALCSTPVVFKTHVDGRTLTLDLGRARGQNATFRDRQTESWWQQATGEAFEGPLKGRRL